MKMKILLLILLWSFCDSAMIPIVINTWSFDGATDAVWSRMQKGPISALDAVTIGATACEDLQCDHTVGYGGNPDENGESTLDALIFDGATMDMGAVGGLRRVKGAMRVARHVLEHTQHSFLVGDLATQFARDFNFTEETLTTDYSTQVWQKWKSNSCQPNFWKNVVPDPRKNCGPYEPLQNNFIAKNGWSYANSMNHDTIGVIAIDEEGNVVAGTTTNGANHKIPGRVGDSPIPGAGAYADNDVGAAVATGDGDIMMRFLPSFLAVEQLRNGASPTKAAQMAIRRIAEKYPNFFGAVLVTTNKGEIGAACNGMTSFPYNVASKAIGGIIHKVLPCNTGTNNKEDF